ncbi:hypothetical protein H4R18_003776 [Coemansia javaensis]|uniref:Uncharacterized protein n=1 Tax=Coemansia javaensis TaxID=2761396 RepID=A0A9W8HDK3_9FUNG|nr:hypothetical protein H4R18_003776 [Coemansia javaensis]
MRTTLVTRAKAQHSQWRRHVPLIKFVGPRKALWAKQDAARPAPQSSTAAPGPSGAIEFWELPARYRPLPMSQAEIEAIESGGASLL